MSKPTHRIVFHSPPTDHLIDLSKSLEGKTLTLESIRAYYQKCEEHEQFITSLFSKTDIDPDVLEEERLFAFELRNFIGRIVTVNLLIEGRQVKA